MQRDRGNEKERDKFEKRLIGKINSTATAKNWSDLLPIMKDVYSHLSKNNSYDFHLIPDKKLLAKRLAQSLNPVCPSGLHEIALDVYEVILKNIMENHNNTLMDNLYLYAYGLFPFFPNASLPNKKKILENIVEPIFLKLNKDELKLSLPGLLSSLIPGLDDNNDETTKMIFSTFNKFTTINNGEFERDFFGVYWMLLLRCQHLRASGIKYLLEKCSKYIDYEKLDEKGKMKLVEQQYPNINTTIINALSEIIKDSEIPTVRNGMDFIITRFPLTKNNKMMTDKAKINLIISGLSILNTTDDSKIRRLKQWILGINSPEDEVSFKSEDMEYKINLLIEAFKIIFNPDDNWNESELSKNITIISALFKTEEEFINLILPKISPFILKCVINYWQVELDGSEKVGYKDIIKKTIQLFEFNKSCFQYLWMPEIDSIKKIENSKDYSKQTNEKKILKLINELNLQLKFGLVFFDMKTNEERIKYYFPLITNLLNIIKNLSPQKRIFKQLKQIIIMTLSFLKSIQEAKVIEKKAKKEQKEKKEEKMQKEKIEKSKSEDKDNDNINEESSFIFEIYDKDRDEEGKNVLRLRTFNEDNEENDENEENQLEEEEYYNAYNINELSYLTNILKNKKIDTHLIKDFSDTVVAFQEYYIKLLDEYCTIGDQATNSDFILFRKCTELIIRLQEYSQKKENEIPQWFKYLEKIIFKKEINLRLSIEAANVLLDLNLSTSLKNNMFLKIKKYFISENIHGEILDKKDIEEMTKKIKIKTNCFELFFAKFYFLSNKQINNQTLITQLLLKMFLIDKKRFIEIIDTSLNVEDENLSENIKLFNNFWKLTNEYYPKENFFKKGECSFKMIELLDNRNPLLRHLSKIWLNQSNQRYHKIIDPLMMIFLDKNILYEFNRVEGVHEYIKEFETSKILDAFIRLKNIILNSRKKQFLTEKQPNDELKRLLKFEYFPKEGLNYIQSLISISLHYTKTKSMNSLDNKFRRDIFTVNVAACEFLEFLLNSIDDKQFLLTYGETLSNEILQLLTKAFDSNNEVSEVMIVQLLDVLKALFFQFPLELIKTDENKKDLIKKEENKKIIFSLLNNGVLKNSLKKGMTNDNFYIREHFLEFTKKCIETYISIITLEDKTELQKFYKLCNGFIQPLSSYLHTRVLIDTKSINDSENFSHYDRRCNDIIFKNYCEEYKEYKTYDEGDVLSILKSIRVIIKNCFKNEILEKSNNAGSKQNVRLFFVQLPFIKKKAIRTKNYNSNWNDYKKELANSLKANNPFISFLTTVVIDYTDKKANKEISEMPNSLYEDQITTLLNSFLSVWINQSDRYELYDYCLNANGVLAPPVIDPKKTISQSQTKLLKNLKDVIANNPIKQIIIEIANNLFITDSIKFISKLINLWCLDNNSIRGNQDNVINDKQYKLSIIELLISMEIPVDIVLFCIGVELQNKIVVTKQIYSKKDKNYSTPFNQSQYEAKVFHFIYSYLLLNPIEYTGKKKEAQIIEVWKELITIFNNSINGTKILYSFCWIYEILQLAGEKFNLRPIDNKDIKLSVENIFSSITNKLMDAVFSDKFDSKYFNEERYVLPILPHVYSNIISFLYKDDNLYKKNMESKNERTKLKLSKKKSEDHSKKKKNDYTSIFGDTPIGLDPELKNQIDYSKKAKTSIGLKRNSFDKAMVDPFNDINIFYTEYIQYSKSVSEYYENNKNGKRISPNKLNGSYQNLAFVILKEDFYSLLKNLFDDSIIVGKKYYPEMINKLLILITKLKDKEEIKKDPYNNNSFKYSFANEFLINLIENSAKNIVSCAKGSLMDYIKSPQIFNVNQRELHGRRIIISNMADYYPEILSDLIHEINNEKLILSKKTDDEKKKILRRVSFVIYSCQKDKFNKNFELIKTTAKNLLTNYNVNNSLQVEIFLIMRMLFLRFSHDGVMQMIRDLWPIIFTELVQNIEDKTRNQDPNLLSESFKFVELLSLANIEEFSLYQWIFMLDTYDMKDLDIRKDESLLKKLLNNNGGENIFRPLSLYAFPNKELDDIADLLKGENKGKSELYIKSKKLEPLKNQILQFFYSIGDMNSYKVDVNYRQIENNIENDFIEQENQNQVR